MAKILEIRNRTPFSNHRRNISQIKHIVRHHSATDSGNFDSFMRHWRNERGWGTGGYHEIILRNGTVQLCYDAEQVTNGVANYNTPCYHICVVGNGSFTEEQEEAWNERVKYNMERLNIPVNEVKGHREMPGANTACPGIDMDLVRGRIEDDELVIDGSWGSATSRKAQRYFGTKEDGIISGQPDNFSTRNIPSAEIGTGGSDLVEAMQQWLGTPVDRIITDPSMMVRALQKRFNMPIVDSRVSFPSEVVKEFQRRLNRGRL